MSYSRITALILLIAVFGCNRDATTINKNVKTAKNTKTERKYSIMSESDYKRQAFTDNITLMLELDKHWKQGLDQFERPTNELISPVMTYGELQALLNFQDSDVTLQPHVRKGRPQATITTPWLICNMLFLDKIYEGSNKSVKLIATVVDSGKQKIIDQRRNRKYNYPSIMEKDDYFLHDGLAPGLLTELVVQRWRITRDRFGRLCKFVSPAVTYPELQHALNFNDKDLTLMSDQASLIKYQKQISADWRSGNYLEFDGPSIIDDLFGRETPSVKLEPVVPFAVIDTEWLTCYIKQSEKSQHGKEMFQAIVIDKKAQAYANAEAEYTSNRGVLRIIMDLFITSPH